MFKIILVSAVLVAVASAGLAPLGGAVNYGFNIIGGGAGRGVAYGGYGGYGAGSVKVSQVPNAYNYNVQTTGPLGGHSYINQAASFHGAYGGYGAGAGAGAGLAGAGLGAGALGFGGLGGAGAAGFGGAGLGGVAGFGGAGLGGAGLGGAGFGGAGFGGAGRAYGAY